MSLSYNKAIVFIRRLFNKRRQDQSSWTDGYTTWILGIFLPNPRVTYCKGKSKSVNILTKHGTASNQH
jgi:hypothetical protein